MADYHAIERHSGGPGAIPKTWVQYRDSVQAELSEIVDSTPSSLRSIIRYHMGWEPAKGYARGGKPGKCVRSILHLLSCRAAGGSTAQMLPAAAALELVHNVSLIHDDIQDRSYERRGRLTVWRLWGQPQAINTGDFMFALAALALLRLKDNDIPSHKIVHCLDTLTEACIDLCEGQYLDMEFENRVDITVEDYLNMIAKKTAALIAVSAAMGAYLGGGADNVRYFRGFGEALGMAYQIRDDVLGIWGTKDRTGKSVEEDIRQRKKTLPVVYALQASRDKAELASLYSQTHIDGGDKSAVVRILDRSGAREHAENLMRQYYNQSLEQLEASGLQGKRQAPLREMARALTASRY
jgi:geranylgeranyl diphosphate synthase, type I